MKKIKSALISVSDKSGLKPLLQTLKNNNIKIISSGGTFREIKKLFAKSMNEVDVQEDVQKNLVSLAKL